MGGTLPSLRSPLWPDSGVALCQTVMSREDPAETSAIKGRIMAGLSDAGKKEGRRGWFRGEGRPAWAQPLCAKQT